MLHCLHRLVFFFFFLCGLDQIFSLHRPAGFSLIDAIVCVLFQLAKKFHPDTNKDDPEAEKKFQEVSKAYEVSLTA